ncbi:MAG: glycosyltransferase [Bacteroidota bacterium]
MSSSYENAQQFSSKSFPRRIGKYLAVPSAAHLVLYSIEDSTRVVLNQSSAMLWQLASGNSSVEEMKMQLAEIFTLSENIEFDEIKDGLLDLKAKNLLEIEQQPIPSKAFVKVGFTNFATTFNPKHNCLLQILSEQAFLILANIDIEEPDILFYGDLLTNTQEQNHEASNLKVGCFLKKTNFTPELFHYSLTSFPIEHPKASMLPSDNYLTTWNDYLPKKQSELIKQIADKIFDLLKASQDSQPSQQTEAPASVKELLQEPDLIEGHLTIGMAVYDDFDGLYFTVQAIRFYHPEVLDRIKFIILDNNPTSKASEAIKKLNYWVKNYRYIPFAEFNSTTVKDIIFREADTEYVLCVDSHILIDAGAIKKLLDYWDANPESMDLLQGPLVYDDLNTYSTSFYGKWRGGMFGIWDNSMSIDDLDTAPFEIQMHGSGLFACRKKAWLGFNPRFRGFGGEEGYIHEKFRQAGRKTLCLPFLKWVHRFNQGGGVSYPNLWLDRIRNYYIGHKELGLDTSPIELHFSELIGTEAFNSIKLELEAEFNNPLFYFDAIYFIYSDKTNVDYEVFQKMFEDLHIQRLIRHFKVLHNEYDPSKVDYKHTRIHLLEKAQKYGFQQVLLIEDRAVLTSEIITHFVKIVELMKQIDWCRCYVSNPKNDQIEATLFDVDTPFTPLPDDVFIAAYHHSDFSSMQIEMLENVHA